MSFVCFVRNLFFWNILWDLRWEQRTRHSKYVVIVMSWWLTDVEFLLFITKNRFLSNGENPSSPFGDEWQTIPRSLSETNQERRTVNIIKELWTRLGCFSSWFHAMNILQRFRPQLAAPLQYWSIALINGRWKSHLTSRHEQVKLHLHFKSQSWQIYLDNQSRSPEIGSSVRRTKQRKGSLEFAYSLD